MWQDWAHQGGVQAEGPGECSFTTAAAVEAGCSTGGPNSGCQDPLVLRALRFTNDAFTMSPTQLYVATQASSSGMAKMLRGLTEKGLVERLPNPDDARSSLVRLTPQGASVVEEIIDQLQVALFLRSESNFGAHPGQPVT